MSQKTWRISKIIAFDMIEAKGFDQNYLKTRLRYQQLLRIRVPTRQFLVSSSITIDTRTSTESVCHLRLIHAQQYRRITIFVKTTIDNCSLLANEEPVRNWQNISETMGKTKSLEKYNKIRFLPSHV